MRTVVKVTGGRMRRPLCLSGNRGGVFQWLQIGSGEEREASDKHFKWLAAFLVPVLFSPSG